MPNIYGTWQDSVENQSYSALTGAFSDVSRTGDGVDGNEGWFIKMKFDASQYNSIYGASSHVTPVNTAVNTYVYAGKVDTSKGSLKDTSASCVKGDYYYTDGTCSSSYTSSKTVKGIVRYVGKYSNYTSVEHIWGSTSTASTGALAENNCKQKGGQLASHYNAADIPISVSTSQYVVKPITSGYTYWSYTTSAYKCTGTTSSTCSSTTAPSYAYYWCYAYDYLH